MIKKDIMTYPTRKTFFFPILFFFSFLITGIGQTVEDGSLFDEISDIIGAMPGSDGDDYADPDNMQLDKWNEIIDDLLNGDYADAALLALDIDYELVAYTDSFTDKLYYLLRSTGANYWGTYLYNPDYCRSLVLQAPHPRADFNTGKEGIHVFLQSDALFFAMSGTHRCNHQDSTACSGSTRSCNEEGDEFSHKFRVSDMAHSATTIFQATTQSLYNTFDDSYFVSLHGFTKKNTDPYVILSNGTQITPNTDYINTLDDMLFAEDTTLTFKIAHIDDWDRLIGTTNTQGRYINASNDICLDAANSTNGRFIHMEQEKMKLRDDITGWDKVANAFINTFPCMSLPVNISSFDVLAQNNNKVQLNWQTASEINNDYFEIQRSRNGREWDVIGRLQGAGNSQWPTVYSYMDIEPYPGLSYYRLKQIDYDKNHTYSATKTARLAYNIKTQTRLFPNPTNRYVTIEGASDLEQITIYNLLGQRLNDQIGITQNNESNYTLDLSGLPSGAYMVATKDMVYRVYKQTE